MGAILSYVLADVKVSSPAAGATISGTTLSIQWEESGTKPPITEFANYAIFLCAGGNSADDFVSCS